MKNVTRFFVASVLMGIGVSSYAQCDMKCTKVNNPTANQNIFTASSPIIMAYDRTNIGAPITAADTVYMDIYVNGVFVTNYIRGLAAMATGAVESTQGATGVDFSTLGLSPGPVDVCIATRVTCDTDPVADNQSCVTVMFHGNVNHDAGIEPGSVAVTDSDPSVAAPNKIYSNKFYTLKEIEFKLKNFGTTPILEGFPTRIYAYVNNGTVIGPLIATMYDGDLAPGASRRFTIDAEAAGLNWPSNADAGTFEICIYNDDLDPFDQNTTNNYDCPEFQMVNVVGIEDVTESASEQVMSNVFFNNSSDLLNVTFSNKIKGNVELVITNTSGQVIRKVSVNANGQTERINLSDASNGLYVISMFSVEGTTESQKFVKN